MILQYFILNVFLITIVTQGIVSDLQPPVFTNCPNDFVKDGITNCNTIRITWQEPTAKDDSGTPPSITSNRHSGGLFPVPGVYDVNYSAKDVAGNEAICNFRITLKTQSPVFTSCPSDIVQEDTILESRVYWQAPTAKDGLGQPVPVTCNRQSGDIFAVPSSSEVICKAKDAAGNEATCSFRITLKRKTCPLYAAPKNGALACYNKGGDYSCVVMCKDWLDFVFNPPMMYYCTAAQWNFYTLPSFPFQSQLPWPDCSNTANPSHWKQNSFSDFFFNGDANDPNVQDTIKTKYISVLNSGQVPPIFCKFDPQCNKDNVEVFAGDSTVSTVFTSCPSDIMQEHTKPETRVNWQAPTAKDSSGQPLPVTCNKHSGDIFAVPSSSEVVCKAKDAAGNEAICSFRITLKRKTCPLYAAPKNGALACYNNGGVYTCVVMCKDGFDFVFNPPMLYFCSSAQWQFYTLPSAPFQSQLPWPDCSNTANQSYWTLTAYSDFFFNGDANDPNVQDTIKTKYMSLMNSASVPPFFCKFDPQCNEHNVEAYAGDSTV